MTHLLRRAASRVASAIVDVSARLEQRRGNLPDCYVAAASLAWDVMRRIAGEVEDDAEFVGTMWHHGAPVPVWRVGDDLVAGSWAQYAEEHRDR